MKGAVAESFLDQDIQGSHGDCATEGVSGKQGKLGGKTNFGFKDLPSVGTSVFVGLDTKHDVFVGKDGRDRVYLGEGLELSE